MDIRGNFQLNKDREGYFTNIALKASELCIKEYDTREVTDEDRDCIKNVALKLHNIVNTSKLERWAVNPDQRPYQEYYWKKSKI